MPVRDLDAFATPGNTPIRALGNRGASGIDGIVSAAFGASAGSGESTLCILGDLAFFHDQNGLLWSREPDAPVVFLLIDNDGGGIFHMLPVREHEPHFTRLFATPHGLDLRHAADLYGIPFSDVEPADVGAAVTQALDGGVTRVIRVRTNRVDNERRHREVAEAVAGSVVAALG
jgi:2-succinyl-5-enolpyruvyl-6-hydroxy-3-cyclohexene-1-carboxylate synthase